MASLQPPQKKRHKKKKHTWHISHAISSSPVLLKPLCDLRARGCPVARLSQQTQAALASRRAKLCEERPQLRRSHGQPRAGAPWWGRIKVVPKTAMARDGIGSCWMLHGWWMIWMILDDFGWFWMFLDDWGCLASHPQIKCTWSCQLCNEPYLPRCLVFPFGVNFGDKAPVVTRCTSRGPGRHRKTRLSVCLNWSVQAEQSFKTSSAKNNFGWLLNSGHCVCFSHHKVKPIFGRCHFYLNPAWAVGMRETNWWMGH